MLGTFAIKELSPVRHLRQVIFSNVPAFLSLIFLNQQDNVFAWINY